MSTLVYNPGALQITTLTGTEHIALDAGGAVSAFTTPQAIANLAATNEVIGITVGATNSTGTSVTSSTTLTTAAGLTVALNPGTYLIDIYLSVTNGASGGVKVNIGAGSTLTQTTFNVDTWAYNTTTVAAQVNNATFASNEVAYTGSVTAVTVQGVIVVSVAGNAVVQFAQNVSNGTATTVNAGSFASYTRIA